MSDLFADESDLSIGDTGGDTTDSSSGGHVQVAWCFARQGFW